jgi:hypothetical protein
MLKFILSEDLLNSVLELSQSLPVLLPDEGNTHKVGELRKVFDLAVLWLHDCFGQTIIILF